MEDAAVQGIGGGGERGEWGGSAQLRREVHKGSEVRPQACPSRFLSQQETGGFSRSLYEKGCLWDPFPPLWHIQQPSVNLSNTLGCPSNHWMALEGRPACRSPLEESRASTTTPHARFWPVSILPLGDIWRILEKIFLVIWEDNQLGGGRRQGCC